MAIEMKNVCYTYMDDSAFSHAALKDICLTVNENEFVALIGHTGSGKSTLISHMNGLMQPQSGKVTVDGLDMSDKLKRKEGRTRVGMVFQYPEYQLFEETVKKDIAFGPHNMGLSDEECDERVREAMELVGLSYEKFADKSPFDLSGGERRRAALAGIIAMRPKYLVLDEPMAGLDPMGRRRILDTVISLRSALHCAVVMVSHSMDDVARIAERVVVMHEGSIVMDGAVSEVFTHTEKLREIGLEIPTAARIADGLRMRGVDVPKGICTIEALSEYLTGRLKKC
ncbi:MAG: energy-coupling factor transporter ATPase [Clostridia bacterium]|nr:energy-coupling factor transporter ATPase [Clostridia bacterium]